MEDNFIATNTDNALNTLLIQQILKFVSINFIEFNLSKYLIGMPYRYIPIMFSDGVLNYVINVITMNYQYNQIL